MHHGLHDAPMLKCDIFIQLGCIQHGTRGNARLAHQLHGIIFGLPPRPIRDHLIHFRLALDPISWRQITGIADQILSPNEFQQSIPVFRIGAAGHNIDVVVRTAGRAGVKTHRRIDDPRHFTTATLRRLAGQAHRGERNAHIVQDCVLHRDLQFMSFSRLPPFV